MTGSQAIVYHLEQVHSGPSIFPDSPPPDPIEGELHILDIQSFAKYIFCSSVELYRMGCDGICIWGSLQVDHRVSKIFSRNSRLTS